MDVAKITDPFMENIYLKGEIAMVKTIIIVWLAYIGLSWTVYAISENWLTHVQAEKEKKDGTGDGKCYSTWVWIDTYRNFKKAFRINKGMRP